MMKSDNKTISRGGIFTVMKKELARFFGDRRMAFTTILLPGLMIYVMYSLMGNAFETMFTPDETYTPRVSVVDMPDFMVQIGESAGIDFTPAADIDSAKDAVLNGSADAAAAFTPDFTQAVAQYDVKSGAAAPVVEIYYNSVSTQSASAYEMLCAILDSYESSIANKFDVNPGGEEYDLASEEEASGFVFASMMPMLILIFLFSGCMAVAPESIAGEKERGTIATMLITPVKRGGIAVGKISALAIIAMLSGISSALGTIISLPKLMGSASEEISGSTYGAWEYVLIGVVILSTVLLLVTLISIISAFAKTVKEAQTYVSPLMIVVMAVGITALFGSAQESLAYYLIPVYNSVQCMSGIFSFDINPAHIALTVGMNALYTGAGVFALAKMFGSERVMFSK